MKDGKRRSFSLANAPHDDELLQLHVRNYPGGSFSEHVFTSMKEKEILRFEGPLGTFFLREESDKPIIFVASGTGFAPIKSMIESLFHSSNMHSSERQIVLYLGNPHQVRSLFGRTGGGLATVTRQFHLHPGSIGTPTRR
jgi:CDP-4-dehydro-6-deoxyglucose reductase